MDFAFVVGFGGGEGGEGIVIGELSGLLGDGGEEIVVLLLSLGETALAFEELSVARGRIGGVGGKVSAIGGGRRRGVGVGVGAWSGTLCGARVGAVVGRGRGISGSGTGGSCGGGDEAVGFVK